MAEVEEPPNPQCPPTAATAHPGPQIDDQFRIGNTGRLRFAMAAGKVP
jgi:hypothetical protein